MSKKTDPDLTEWSGMLNALTPKGYLPRKGTPRAAMADFISGQLAPKVELEPRTFGCSELFTGDQIQEALAIADRVSGTAREYIGRRVVSAPQDLRDLVVASGVPEKLAKGLNLQFRPDVDALVLYYETGHWVPMHLDDQLEYEFNLLTMLRRTKQGESSRTATYFWGADGKFQAVDLEVGHSVFFHASYTPHGRPPVPASEDVVLLAVGLGRPGAEGRA